MNTRKQRTKNLTNTVNVNTKCKPQHRLSEEKQVLKNYTCAVGYVQMYINYFKLNNRTMGGYNTTCPNSSKAEGYYPLSL